MRRLAFVLFAVALVCGCICCGDVNLGGLQGATTTTEPYCTPPYIQIGTGCCLDYDGNGVCDSDESADTIPEPPTLPDEATETTQPPTPTTHATATTEAPATTLATTVAGESCSDGLQNQGEEYVDCGGPCADCLVMRLTGSWREFKTTDYKFRFDEKQVVENNIKYWIEIKTPDGLTDRRYLSTGESFVDYLRFGVINYGEDTPKVYMKLNTEDLASVPPQATLLTVGGQSCTQMGSEMCERNYAGYKIRMVNRIDNGAKITVLGPTWEVPTPVTVTEGTLSYSPDHALVIGGFFDRSHFITGGYSLFYVYTR
jgi:hypothetical protein